MKTARKILIPVVVFVVTVFAVFFLLSFIFQTNNQPKPIFLKVVGFWDPKVFNSLKKEYQEKNPTVTIEYEQKDPKRYFVNLKADLDTKRETSPDVFWWHSGWGSELATELDSLPPQIMSREVVEKTYYPVTKTTLQIKGTYRGLPLEIDGLALLYNKDIFASANFSETPKTWTTLRNNYVSPLTLRSQKDIFASAIALGSVVNVENYPEIVGLFLLQNGATFTQKGKLTLYVDKEQTNNALSSQAIDYFYDFAKSNKTWDNTLPNSIEAFAKGKVAMILLPAYKIHDLKGFVKKENLKLNFAVSPVPQLPGNQPVSWGSFWSLGVNSKSQVKSDSWQLAKFLTSETTLRKIFQLETALYGFGRAYPQIDLAKEQTTNAYLAAYLAQAPYAQSWYLNSDTFDGGLNDQVIAEFKKALAAVENGNTGSTETLKKLTKNLNPILKKYGVVSQ